MGKRSYSPGSRLLKPSGASSSHASSSATTSSSSYSPPSKRIRELPSVEPTTTSLPRVPIEITLMSADGATADSISSVNHIVKVVSSSGASANVIPSSPSPMAFYTNPRTADIPTIPVVKIDDNTLPSPATAASAAIFAKIVSFVDEPADLISLCLTSKLVYVPALRRLWSGLFFPTIGYVSVR